MPEALPPAPQDPRTCIASGKVSLARWLMMAAISAGSFAVNNAAGETPDKNDISVLQPKGGSGIPKAVAGQSGITESESSHPVITVDNSERIAGQTPLNIREKYKPENVCYIGDSYMGGITEEGEVQLNIFARTGRPFVSRAEKWDGDDVRTVALKAMENPDCRLMIISGGLNDFHSYHRRLGVVYENLKEAYAKISEVAKEKGVEIVIFNVPKIPKLPMDKDEKMKKRVQRKKEIDDAIEEFNRFLLTINGANVLDTMAIMRSSCKNFDKCNIWRKDGIHPRPNGYKALFESL